MQRCSKITPGLWYLTFVTHLPKTEKMKKMGTSNVPQDGCWIKKTSSRIWKQIDPPTKQLQGVEFFCWATFSVRSQRKSKPHPVSRWLTQVSQEHHFKTTLKPDSLPNLFLSAFLWRHQWHWPTINLLTTKFCISRVITSEKRYYCWFFCTPRSSCSFISTAGVLSLFDFGVNFPFKLLKMHRMPAAALRDDMRGTPKLHHDPQFVFTLPSSVDF